MFSRGRMGNDRPIILVSNESEIQQGLIIYKSLEVSVTNPLIHITLPAQNEISGDPTVDSSMLVNAIKERCDEYGLNFAKLIIVGVQSTCSHALIAAAKTGATHVLGVAPAHHFTDKNPDQREISARIAPTLIGNLRHNDLGIIFFCDASAEIYSSYDKSIRVNPHASIFTYNWNYKANSTELIQFFIPMLITCLGIINYSQGPIVSRVHDEYVLVDKPAHQPIFSQGEIESLELIDSRLEIKGNAQISRVPAGSYGKQHVKLSLVNNEITYRFALGPIKVSDITFRKWTSEQTDFSVSSFGTFGGLGIDLSNISEGRYKLELEIRNGKVLSKNSPELNIRDFYHIFVSGTTVIRITIIDGAIDIARFESGQSTKSISENVLTDVKIQGRKLMVSLPFLRLIDEGTGPAFKCTLLLNGSVSYVAELCKDSTVDGLLFDLPRFINSGTYDLAILTENNSKLHSISLGSKMVSSMKTEPIHYLKSMLQEQFVQYLNSSTSPFKDAGVNVIDTLVSSDNVFEIIEGGILLFDVLDLAIVNVIQRRTNDLIADSSIFASLPDTHFSSWGRGDASVTMNILTAVIQKSPSRLVLVSTRVPHEADRLDGERYFFDREVINEINEEVTKIEKSIISLNSELEICNSWKRGMRASRQQSDDVSPFVIEPLFFARLQEILSDKLLDGNFERSIII